MGLGHVNYLMKFTNSELLVLLATKITHDEWQRDNNNG